MKKIADLSVVLFLGLVGFCSFLFSQPVNAFLPAPEVQEITPIGPEIVQPPEIRSPEAVHALYFYSNDCPHCLTVLNELILPMQSDLDGHLDIRLLDISVPEYYEALLLIEDTYSIDVSQRSIPALIIGDHFLIGETDIRSQFSNLVAEGLETGGIFFSQIEGVDLESLSSVAPGEIIGGTPCNTEENCMVDAPIFAAYFFQTGCKECSRVEADSYYLRTQYPQLQIVEFNIFDYADLAEWLTARIDPDSSFQSPALFIGETLLFGEDILPEKIIPILEQYRGTGTDPVWLEYEPESGQKSIITRFTEMGWLAVVAAGLVDGINPCAFATLIFFVSYLAVSGRKGKEILAVGGAFTLGVFLAYLAIGLGLYQILDLLGNALNIIAKAVYLLTAFFCLVLAVYSFLDYRKVKAGNIGDMQLKLPVPLRKKINAVIRKG